MGKTERSWGKLFDKYNIIKEINSNGYFRITAAQINEFRESRLMAKFDHKANLPPLFTENNFSILPISRGSYIISTFDAYHDITPVANEILQIDLNNSFETIDPRNLYSESAALHCAHLSGMIDSVLEDETSYTLSGRMSTLDFSYKIRIGDDKYFEISVDNSQCEIDGGFEGANKVALIEAKNFLPSDFIIRQLFYPYRLWKQKLNKAVIPVFLAYSNDVFRFFIYHFDDDNVYNSIRLVGQKNFMIAEEEVTLDDICCAFKTAQMAQEPIDVPFPQADSFTRIIDLLGLLYNDDLTKEEITTNYDFDPRQTDYYTNAIIYLGLACKFKNNGEIIYTLSNRGRQILSQRHKTKHLALVRQILRHRIFYESLKVCLNKGDLPSKKEVLGIMTSYPPNNVGADSTFRRRSSTVIGWIDWILKLQNP